MNRGRWEIIKNSDSDRRKEKDFIYLVLSISSGETTLELLDKAW
jgi:hypothetical protein